MVDTHIQKDDDFEFLTKVTDIVAAVFKNFDWGKNNEELADAWQSLGQVLANPAKYSTTRFANCGRNVYTNFRKDYEMRDGDSKERQKAADAEKLMNYICNVKFVPGADPDQSGGSTLI